MPTITMPQLGESVTEGTIGRWLKKPGDRVRRDEALVEVITDKVNAEIPAPVAGVLERITASEGTVVAVGQEIAFLTPDADRRGDRSDPVAAPVSAPVAEPRPISASIVLTPGQADEEGPRSSPLVRKLVREHGLDLRTIRGTGLGGRVTRDDVEAHLREKGASAEPPVSSHADSSKDERIVPSAMRRTIAQRLSQSAREIPHAWLLVDVDVTQLVRLRESVKRGFQETEGVDLTYVPFVLKAAVESLREVPVVNASWQNDQIILKREINLGVAVALDDGLVVPVIRDADQKNVVGLAHALADVVSRARSGKLTIADVEGGTFTVNNTGAFGSIASQPIINYPQAAIMNMEAIVKRPVVVDDAIAIRSVMNLCLSFDHRILDGATAGRFLQNVKRRLESWRPDSAL
ncbi:MAG TPA: dihydrolipoamide acetyltransferase family protein [Chloroflexota bacterium]|nr:dihydrolipoamide acetyltransferase family protein [Chloroflexota bacterium]